jgi:hypothetical protein
LGIALNADAVMRYPPKPSDRPVIVEVDGAIGLE